MRTLIKLLLFLVVFAALAVGGAYLIGGMAAGPLVQVVQPQRAVGHAGTLEVVVQAPGARLTRLEATLEQNGARHPIFSLADPGHATITQESADRMRVAQPLGRATVPSLQSGQARLEVVAERAVLFGLRKRATTITQDLAVRLTPPRLEVLSTHHYVNHGGSELIVYRTTPPEAISGVKVGDVFYPGYPASGGGVAKADPSIKMAFFALLYDQDLKTPIELIARDEAGNQARTTPETRIFPKVFKQSRIEVDDRFLQRVVPEVAGHAPDLGPVATSTPEERLASFLKINGELRRRNADRIAAVAKDTSPSILWQGAFEQLSNSQVESAFADHRTYFYQGREVDRQVHLGFDLAVTSAVEIRSANRGKVALAEYLGIYGNCVIVDHGMGVQTLYAHLSSIGVRPGEQVEKGQTLGKSGMTGLAGGDHLHFTLLVHGHPVNPVDWWDPHWIQDRVTRKLTLP